MTDILKHDVSVYANTYQNTNPYPYMYLDNFLETGFAEALQQEILAIPSSAWDRYANPFETKYTLRDKFAFPPLLSQLMDVLQSPNVIQQISTLTGHDLLLDTTRMYWGVHMYENGDKLDIHVDAGHHPTTHLKKQVTFGIYLSKAWTEACGCALEIWKGTSAGDPVPRLESKVTEIHPLFNRAVIFTCNDYAWHGNPDPVHAESESRRIFITLSYMSASTTDTNQRRKAYFVARPGDPEDADKDRLRALRANPDTCRDIYAVASMS